MEFNSFSAENKLYVLFGTPFYLLSLFDILLVRDKLKKVTKDFFMDIGYGLRREVGSYLMNCRRSTMSKPFKGIVL